MDNVPVHLNSMEAVVNTMVGEETYSINCLIYILFLVFNCLAVPVPKGF